MSTSNIVPVIKSFNSRVIRINSKTRYVCLTDMAKASGKRSNDWSRLKATADYLSALEECTGIPVDQLIIVADDTVANDLRGTWAHPQVAIKFAAWCSPEFEVQTTKWLDELLPTGKNAKHY